MLVTSELRCAFGKHEVAQSQRADLLHLADGARSLSRTIVAEALTQLAHDILSGVEPRAYYKRKAEALLVLGVEVAHARHLRRLQVGEPGHVLLLLGVPG